MQVGVQPPQFTGSVVQGKQAPLLCLSHGGVHLREAGLAVQEDQAEDEEESWLSTAARAVAWNTGVRAQALPALRESSPVAIIRQETNISDDWESGASYRATFSTTGAMVVINEGE